ncbi:unnamed protein product [Strongylus vulgaris]|uniref:Uncharacterized protein n=1 Tax=Strongylus vulgaris TaxID=40348 RepID=A0A3P7LSX9_STRVU|nr:unnamed protein product [Strongylus vulgaris]
MSLDALRLVSEYLTPASRINLARVNASTGEALSRWEDVHSVLFDDTKVVMAGEVFRHQIETGTDLVKEVDFDSYLLSGYIDVSRGLLHTLKKILRHIMPLSIE